MFVYVLNKRGEPIMPCESAVARLLLKDKKAKVKRRTPFTIQLVEETTEFKQTIIGGMDTGSKVVGCAAVANGNVVYQSEVTLRNDVSKKMQQRAMYRRTRRGRKCRYRPARWANRASMRANGRLAPSIRSKVESHLREKKQVESILPISHWKVETASFDIHKITNPDVVGIEYQNGKQKDYYNIKAFILNRDNYTCKSGRKIKHDSKLHAHDAIVICCEDGELINPLGTVFYKKHVASGDYQQTKGSRSEKKIPTGKLFGLRKHDFISTPQGSGFVKGKRATGYFAIENILGDKTHACANIKKSTVRLTARTTTLIQRMERASNSSSH